MTDESDKEKPVTTEPAAQPGGSAGRRRPGRLLTAVIVALIAVAVLVWPIGLLGGDDDSDGGKIEQTAETPFELTYPESWRDLNKQELAVAQGAVAGVRRKDGKAFVLVRREKAARTDYPKFEKELDREFKKRFDDFRKGGARVIQIGGRPTFSYSYVREEQGTAHGVFVVPAGAKASYTLNTVVRGGENEAAQETGAVVSSFEVKN